MFSKDWPCFLNIGPVLWYARVHVFFAGALVAMSENVKLWSDGQILNMGTEKNDPSALFRQVLWR